MIKLVKLNLDGYRSYDKANIPLDLPGITYVTGKIGSGKSTIPEAIFYLLFGKLLQKKTEFVTLNDLVNKVLKGGYDISLDFLLDDVPCNIREIRGRKNNGLYFKVDGKSKRGKSDQETRKIILDTIGISAEDFRSTAIFGRRQSLKLIHGTSADRSSVLINMFNLDRYSKYYDSCRQDVKLLEAERKNLEGKLEEAQRQLESLKEQKLSLQDIIVDVDTDEIREKISNNKKRASAIQNKISKIKQDLAVQQAFSKNEAKIKAISEEIDELEESLERFDEDTDEHELQKILEGARQTKSSLKYEISTCRSSMEKLKKLGNRCPINEEPCPVDVPKKFKAKNLKQLADKLSELEKKFSSIKKKEHKLSERFGQLMEMKQIESTISVKRKLLEDLKVKPKSVKINTKDLDKYEKQLALGLARIDELNEQLLEAEAAKKNAKLYDTFNQLIKDAENEILKLERERAKITSKMTYFSTAGTVFRKVQSLRIDYIIDLLNDNTNNILKVISNDERSVEIVSKRKTKAGTLDKLGIILHDVFKSIPIELASDGQETQAGLAILFGAWKTINALSDKGISAVWLDEVFGPLDTNSVERVFESVVSVFGGSGAKSLFVISHRKLDTRLFDRQWKFSLVNGITEIDIGD